MPLTREEAAELAELTARLNAAEAQETAPNATPDILRNVFRGAMAGASDLAGMISPRGGLMAPEQQDIAIQAGTAGPGLLEQQSVAPVGRGVGYRTGRSIGQSVLMAPITAAFGGLPAVGIDLAVSGAGGAAAEGLEAQGRPGLGMAAELGINVLPSAAIGLGRAAMGLGTPDVAEELADRAVTGVDTGAAAAARGRAGTGMMQTFAETVPGGRGVVANFRERLAQAFKDTTDKLAYGASKTVDDFRSGQTLQRGITEHVGEVVPKRMAAMAGRLRELVGPDLPTPPTQTMALMQEVTQSAGDIPGLDVLVRTDVFRAAAAAANGATPGPLTLDQMIQSRAIIGERLSNPTLQATVSRGQFKRLYGAMTEDIETAIAASGNPQALNLFRQSRRFWRREMNMVDDTLDAIANKVDPTRLMDTVRRSPQTMAVLRRTLKPEQWDTVVASTVHNMGTARPGAQNAAGDVFSLETFLTNWNSLGDRGRRVLLGGQRYETLRKSMEALTRQASRVRDAGTLTRNAPGTGQAVAALAAGASILSGNLQALGAAMTAMGGSWATAQLMTRPWFVQWLANASAMPVSRLPAMGARLAEQMQQRNLTSEEVEATTKLAGYLMERGN